MKIELHEISKFAEFQLRQYSTMHAIPKDHLTILVKKTSPTTGNWEIVKKSDLTANHEKKSKKK